MRDHEARLAEALKALNGLFYAFTLLISAGLQWFWNGSVKISQFLGTSLVPLSLHPVGPSWSPFVPAFCFVFCWLLLTQAKEQEHARQLEDRHLTDTAQALA